MIVWWIIILALAALLIVFKSQLAHMKHRFSILFFVILAAIFIITFVKVVNANSIDLKSPSGIFSGVKLYFSWLGHLFGNLKVITGNMLRMEWFGNITR